MLTAATLGRLPVRGYPASSRDGTASARVPVMGGWFVRAVRAGTATGAISRVPTTMMRLLLFLLALGLPADARASLLSPELEDKLATFLAIFILFFVPVVLIVLFWMVHILPEKIAHKRNHPQFEAIRTLCLLSLVFGGLLWPFAWLWAYSKPVFHKMAYGTDTGEHGHEGDAWEEGQGGRPQAVGLHERLARLEERGVPSSELKTLRADLEALEAKFAGAKLADEQ
jgi:CBS domain containing-hemolysin-like protein